jgi:hypothetical protein
MSGARSWLWVMPLALLVTALLAAVATWSQARAIQSDLTSRSQAALASAGISGGEVSFDGRDATLQGFPADKAQPAADAVRKVEGVRGVGVVVQEKPAMTSSREPRPALTQWLPFTHVHTVASVWTWVSHCSRPSVVGRGFPCCLPR